jgi:hypothetical protein
MQLLSRLSLLAYILYVKNIRKYEMCSFYVPCFSSVMNHTTKSHLRHNKYNINSYLLLCG